MQRVYVKTIAWALAKLSRMFPNHVYAQIEGRHFHFNVFGLRFLKGHLPQWVRFDKKN